MSADPTLLIASIHAPTVLMLSALVMGAAAAIMTFYAASQCTYRGHGWWLAAMWLAAAGGLLQWLRPLWAGAVVPGNLLLLAWPMLVVTGLRRFYNRDRLPSSSAMDALALALAYLPWLAVWASPALQAWRSPVFGAALLGLHLYAAWFILRLEACRQSRALKALLAVMFVQALVPLLALLLALAAGEPPVPGRTLLSPWVVLPSMVTMLFSVHVCLVLTHERTEHDLRETQRQLRVLADTDMLTQVPNRRHFEELAGAALGGPSMRAVLMLFDIDHFKRINDSLGHAVGDDALRLVARCTREMLRTRDVLGRFGGDEFMLLLPGASVEDALLIADRLTRRIDEEHRAARSPLRLSLSFGVADIAAGEPLDVAQRRADQALYEAKRQGRRRAVPAHRHGEDTVFEESRSLGLDPL